MRALRVSTTLVVLGVLLLAPVAAIAARDDGVVPTGTYTGSASAGKKGAPFAMTVYIAEGSSGGFEVTFVTPKLPIPVTVRSDGAKIVEGGYDIEVSASVAAIRLSGDGVLRLRQDDDGEWHLYGSGSGSFRGKKGNARGYGERTGETASAADQVTGALTGFLSFGESDEDEVDKPKEYNEADWERVEKGGEDPDTSPVVEARPPSVYAQAFIVILMILLGAFLLIL